MLAIGLPILLHQQPTEVVYPQAAQVQPAPEYVSWAGFGFLPTQSRRIVPTILGSGDWTAVQAATVSPAAMTSAVWPLKIFVLKRVDQVRTLEDGTLYEEKCALETVDVDRINRAVGLLQKLVQAETGGSLRIVPQVTVESEPLVLGGRSLDQAIADYVTPRANGGKYVAEDKVFRGPYSSIMVFHPVPTPATAQESVNGMPVAPISVYGLPGYEGEGNLAITMARRWCESVRATAARSGVLGPLNGVAGLSPITGLPNPLAYVPDQNWAALGKGSDLAQSEIDARLALPYDKEVPDPQIPTKLIGVGYKGVTCNVSVGEDPARGSIISYSERGEARDGGLDFPIGPTGDPIIVPAKTATLDFWAKADSRDALALEVVSPNGKTFDFSLGADVSGSSPVFQADLQRDGTWHEIKLDLKQTGLDSIDHIRLIPTPNSRQHPKFTQGPIVYEFAGFSLSNDPADPVWQSPAPTADSKDSWSRARWAHSAKRSPQLIALMKDPDWFVRLNSIQRYLAEPDPSAEAALTENATLAIDGPTAAAAIDALWKLGTPTAKAVIHSVVKFGVTEQGKAEAALMLGGTKDTTFAAELIPLQQSRGLLTRMAVVDALAELPGENAAIIRMSFLFQEDPELKLEVTKTSDPSDPYQCQKLLWSSVNESSDEVRFVSYSKLVQATDSASKTAGYAGIKDDSIEVRIQLLQFLKAHPNEDNRAALRQAVADRSASVRAAAIEAFSTLDKGVKPEELGSALQDLHPLVQLALIDLAKSKKIVLDDSVLKQIGASPDPEVQTAYKSLG